MTEKKLSSIALIALLTLSIIAVFSVSPVPAALDPHMAVDPTHTVFDAPAVDDTFSVYLNISSSTATFVGYQFYMYWDRTYINATSFVCTPPVWTDYAVPGLGIEANYNDTHGRFTDCHMDTSLTPHTGGYTVCRIDFKIFKVPKAPADPDAFIILSINNTDTFMDDGTGASLDPLYKYDGDVTLKALMAAPPTISVGDPPYPHEYWGVYGQNFTVDIKIKDVVPEHKMWGWEFIMLYNTTLLDTMDVVEGTFLSNFNDTFFIAKFGESMFDPSEVNVTYEDNLLNSFFRKGYGKIHAACLFTNWTIPEGEGILATITFQATYQWNPDVESEAWCWLDLNSTIIADTVDWPGEVVPHISKDGKYHAPVLLAGRKIDCYTGTHRKYMYPSYETRYIGKIPDRNADAYVPQDLVELFAEVTYNGEPVQNKLVQFEVGPSWDNCTFKTDLEGFPLHRVAYTDKDGIASITFRIPWPCTDPERVFGKWKCYQSVDIACEQVNDTLWFEVAWYVWLKGVMVEPDPAYKCNTTEITIFYESHVFTPLSAYFTVVLYDHVMTPIGMDALTIPIEPMDEWCHPKAGNLTLHVHIPKWAYVGVPTPEHEYPVAYVNVYTFRCSLGGMPYCPEAYDTFAIARIV